MRLAREQRGLQFFRGGDIGFRGFWRHRHAGYRAAQEGAGSIPERARAFGVPNQRHGRDQQCRLGIRPKPLGRGAGSIENERDRVARRLFVAGSDGGEGSLYDCSRVDLHVFATYRLRGRSARRQR